VGTDDGREPLGAGTGAAAAPRLPVRASIYIDVDGTVHFGALFEGLVDVANALGPARGERSAPETFPGEPAADDESVGLDELEALSRGGGSGA